MTAGRLTRAPAACRGTVAGPVAGAVAGALSVLLLAGCAPAADVEAEGAEEPVQVTSTSAAGEPDERCAAVISDAVVEGLGWTAAGAAVEVAGRCERSGAGTLLSVGTDPTVRPDAGPGRVERAYAGACADLSGAGEPVPEQDPQWLGLGSGETACVRGLGSDRGGGLIQIYTLSDEGWLVHGQLTDDGDTPTDRVRSAVALLVSQAIVSDWS